MNSHAVWVDFDRAVMIHGDMIYMSYLDFMILIDLRMITYEQIEREKKHQLTFGVLRGLSSASAMILNPAIRHGIYEHAAKSSVMF